LDRNIPNSLISKIRDTGDSNVAGVDEFILLKKNKDETNLLVTFDKETGNTSYGFIIPDNIHPDVLSNIDVITKEVKQKLIENSNTGGSGTF
jgi:cold shock CspA family protein